MTFEELVKRGAEKHGLTLEWTPVEDTVVLRFSRGASFQKELVLFEVTENHCTNENGAPMCAADVVYWMRQRLESRR